MAKKAPVEKDVKKHRKADVMHVSKQTKILAMYASLNDKSFRQFIKIMGDAETNYKLNGRLVLAGNG